MAFLDKELVRSWRPILQALDPMREVGLDEIEALYAERQQSPYRSLATELALASQPVNFKVILCGARGSGKSTELTRLASEVHNDFCVVHTDLAAGLPEEASTLAVVTLLGVAALHVVRNWSRPDDGAAASSEVRSGGRLQAALAKFGDAAPKISTLLDGVSGLVTLFSPAAGVALGVANSAVKTSSAAINVGAEVRHALARGPLEGVLPADKRDDAKAVVDAVNEILAELEQLSGRPPLLLADGLDKRTGVDEVRLALADEYLLQELRAPLVLTGPVNLRHDPRFRVAPGNFRLTLLYNVPVCERRDDGRVVAAAEGVSMLRQLYERRQRAAKLSADLITTEMVERAALMCAGIIREFLELISSTCKLALQAGRATTEPGDLDAAIKARRLEMQGYLNEGHLELLRRVLAKGTLPANPEADTLLFENFIACYPNGDIWFRPHELIVDFVEGWQESS